MYRDCVRSFGGDILGLYRVPFRKLPCRVFSSDFGSSSDIPGSIEQHNEDGKYDKLRGTTTCSLWKCR